MKKLLVATSALVAAGSAAALDVTLGGEIEAIVKYDGDEWTQGNTVLGVWTPGGPAATLSLSAAGESMGWTYGGSMDITGTGPAAGKLYIGSDGIGKVTFAHTCGNYVDMDDNSLEGSDVEKVGKPNAGCVELTGASAAGWSLSAALDVDDLDASVIGVSGSVAGASLAFEIVTGTSQFDAAASTAIGGATIGIEMTGDLDKATSTAAGNTYDLDYEASIDFAAMGLDFGAAIQEDGELQVSTTIGNVTLKMNNHNDGDFADNWSAEYKSTLAEGLTVKAKVASDDSLTVTSTLEF